MSIASRITQIEQHIGNAYDKIEDLGIDLTDVDKNINNISSMLENVWNEYPKVTATDVEEASINGTKKGRMEIDLKGQTYQDTAILPSEYQQVEYIENTENSYIDTGKILTQNNSVECKIKTPSTLADVTSMSFGSRDGASSNNISSNFISNIITIDFNNSNYNTYRASYTNMQVSTEYILYTSKNTRKIYNKNRNVLVENNTICNDTITTPNTAHIFRINPMPQQHWLYGKIRLYYFKIWENDELIMNLIPCYRKSDNEIGLYDLVSNTFLTNQGTGTFAKGDNVTIPNPDFPIPIKNVIGNNNVKIQNKNLFVAQKIVDDSNNTDVYLTQDGFIRFATGGNAIIIKPSFAIKSSTAYTFKFIIKSAVTTTNSFRFTMVYTDGTTQYSQSVSRTDTDEFEMVFSTNGSKTLDFIRNQWTSGKEAFLKIDGSMILEGSYTAQTIPEYVPHQEQNYPFTFAEGQRAMQGTQPKDDGIHNKRTRFVLDGTEDWRVYGTSNNINQIVYAVPANKTPKYAITSAKATDLKCSHFKSVNYSKYWTIENSILFALERTISIQTVMSLNEFKAFLETQYNNNTPLTIEYELAEEEIIPYNETQQAQYNAIKQAKSYNDQTNISQTNEELPFILDIEALKNN